MPWAIHAAFQPDIAGTEHDDPAGPNAGSATEQHAAATVLALEIVRADLGGHPAGDFRHRREEWECAVLELHGLIGDGRRARIEQCLADRRIRRNVQVREEHEVRTQPVELGVLWFFYLHHHVRAPRVVRGHDLGAGRLELLVMDRRAFASPALDEHPMAGGAQFSHAVGRHRNAVLAGLRLGRHPNNHPRLLSTRSRASMTPTITRGSSQ